MYYIIIQYKTLINLRYVTKCDFSRFFILIITNFTDLYKRDKNLNSFFIRYIFV